MSNFVYDLTTLPGSKSDLVPTPPGADLSKYLPATHWNTHIQASYDIRDAIRKGAFQGLLEQASDPSPSDPDAYWWLRDTGVMYLVGPTNLSFGGTITAATPTDPAHLATKNYVDTHASLSPLTTKGDLYTRTATVDARIGVVANGKLLSSNSATTTGLEWIDPPVTTKTLQGAYTDGGAGPQIINLSTSGKGLKIRDTLAGIGEALFAVQNSTGITSHFAVNSDGTVTMTGALTVTGVVIGATPTLATHLTTKGYVDGLLTGLSWKAMVKYASTPAGGDVTKNGDQPIDGFTTTEGDRVLLKNQTNHVENGIWIARTDAAWTRAIDMPAGSDAATTACFVDLGTLNQDTSWFCYTDKPLDIVGTDAIDFQVFSNTISQHNALTGLDGGTSGQYYHLTSAEHVGLHGIATGGVTFASATGVLATDASQLFWDNSSKKLGIGTASPGARLTINSTTTDRLLDLICSNGSVSPMVKIRNTTSGAYSDIAFYNDADNPIGEIGCGGTTSTIPLRGALFLQTASTSTPFLIAQGSTNIFYIDSTNKVGIGTTSPAARLSVKGVSTDDVQQWIDASGNLLASVASTGVFSFRSDIANVSFAMKPLTGSSKNRIFDFFANSDSGNSPMFSCGIAPTVGWVHNTLPGAFVCSLKNGSATALPLYFLVSDGIPADAVPAMTILTTGKVGIGTTSPDSLLDVHGDLTVTGALGLYTVTAGETIAQYQLVYGDQPGGLGRVKLAKATTETSSRVLGVVVTGNTVGNAATIVTCGVYGITFEGTTPTLAHYGQPVYLSSTTFGAVTLTAPGAGTVLLRVGYVVGTGANALVAIHIGDEFQQ